MVSLPFLDGSAKMAKIARTGALFLALSPGAVAQFTAGPGSPVPAGGGPASVAVADFNEDGIQDLAIADNSTSHVTVLLANSMGEFLPPTKLSATTPPVPVPIPPSAVGTRPVSMAVFNCNQHASLAVASERTPSITILLGNGDGSFTTGTPIQLKSTAVPVSIAAANFNGNPGVVIADFVNNQLSLWTANSSCVFSQVAGSPFLVGMNPSSVTIGDFNGDGTPDFAAANKLEGTVSVILSTASGYAPQVKHPLLVADTSVLSIAYPSCIVTADFNADGVLDLAIANEGTNNVTILLGMGAGLFGPSLYTSPLAPISTGASPFSLAVGYFNNDSFPDLAVANVGDNTITVLLGTATGAFNAASGSPFPVGLQPESVAAGYFNGNGSLGLAVANKGDNTVTVFTSASAPVVVSAASLMPPVAPASAVSIFGTQLAASGNATTTSTTTLGGTFATITDYTGLQTLLVLTFTSAGQINAVIPPGVNVAPNPSPVPVPPAVLTVYTASGMQTAVVPLVPVAPGLFSIDGTGKGIANALFGGVGGVKVFACPNPSSPTNCVPLAIDLTGGGQLTLNATGVRNATSVQVNFGGQVLPATATAVSGIPGVQGMDQVTTSIPPNSQLNGLVPVSVTAGGLTSNVVYVEVQ